MDLFWENTNWEEQDKQLQAIKLSPFQRILQLIPTLPGLYVLRGPRQVGKSTWLKTVLKHHVDSGSKCFYLSCEDVPSFKELGEILNIHKGRKVILLDEISFVDGWDRAIKKFIDTSIDHILVITGSHAHDLRRGADQMPGRFGNGGEFTLLPMDFGEFSDARAQAMWKSGDRLEELRTYFRVGGFPAAVAEGGAEGNIPQKSLETYRRWLVGDVLKLGKQESMLNEILIQISRVMQTPISFQSLAQKTSIGSHSTAQDYLAVLESCFAVRSLLAIDQDSESFRFKKGRKFYFTDPLLFHLATQLKGDLYSPCLDDSIAEMVAHEALARRHKRFGYFSSKNGEIDFYSPKKWALEVKWSLSTTNISKAYLNQTLPWKKIWTRENFLTEFPPT